MRFVGILILALMATGCATKGSVSDLTARVSKLEAQQMASESRDLEQDEAIDAAKRTAKDAETNAAYAAQAALNAQKAAEAAAETAKRAFEKTTSKSGR